MYLCTVCARARTGEKMAHTPLRVVEPDKKGGVDNIVPCPRTRCVHMCSGPDGRYLFIARTCTHTQFLKADNVGHRMIHTWAISRK